MGWGEGLDLCEVENSPKCKSVERLLSMIVGPGRHTNIIYNKWNSCSRCFEAVCALLPIFLWFHSSSVASGLITRLKLNENISKLKRLRFFKNVWVFFVVVYLLLFFIFYWKSNHLLKKLVTKGRLIRGNSARQVGGKCILGCNFDVKKLPVKLPRSLKDFSRCSETNKVSLGNIKAMGIT